MLNWIRSKQRVIIFVCVMIICVCLPVMLYANASLPGLVQRNASDGVMLLVEMQHEAGRDYVAAKKDFAYLVERFREHMENRDCSLLLRLLYPELSPEKQLTSALDVLRDSGDDKAETDISKATEIIKQFVSKSRGFAGTRNLTSELHACPEGLVEDAMLALDSSKQYVGIYGNSMSMVNAQKACRENRKAIALAYLVRCVYQDSDSLDDRLRQLRGDINRTIYYNNALTKNNSDLLQNGQLPDTTRKQLEEDNGRLTKYTKSELRRLVIVNALLDSDHIKAEIYVLESADISS